MPNGHLERQLPGLTIQDEVLQGQADSPSNPLCLQENGVRPLRPGVCPLKSILSLPVSRDEPALSSRRVCLNIGELRRRAMWPKYLILCASIPSEIRTLPVLRSTASLYRSLPFALCAGGIRVAVRRARIRAAS
jgi:hypothetical protein